jgi:hypothetical protein
MRGAAAVTPEVAAVAQQVEARRRANQVRLVTYLQEKGVLRKDLAPEEAADIVWALTSYDLYRALVSERHWPAGRYRDWLADTLVDGLLAR